MEKEEQRSEGRTSLWMCCLGSSPAHVLPAPSTDTCKYQHLSQTFSKMTSLWKKKNVAMLINIQSPERKNNRLFIEFMSKILVNLLYTSIYTVCIYSINILTDFQNMYAVSKAIHPPILCKNYIKHDFIYSINPQRYGACIKGLISLHNFKLQKNL